MTNPYPHTTPEEFAKLRGQEMLDAAWNNNMHAAVARAQNCTFHGKPKEYTNGRCIDCMDAIPLNELDAPDFTNPKNFNI